MAPSPPTPGGESFLTRKTIGGLPTWVLLAGGAVAVYILVGRKSSSQAQATAQPSPYPANYGGGTTPVYVLPQGALGGNTGAETGIGGGVTSGQSGTPAAGTPTTDTPTTDTHAATGPQTISIGGTQYDILGLAANPQYQVYGGAPAFFGNANSVAQGPAAQQAAVSGGGYVYTPATYSNLVYPTGGQPPGVPA